MFDEEGKQCVVPSVSETFSDGLVFQVTGAQIGWLVLPSSG